MLNTGHCLLNTGHCVLNIGHCVPNTVRSRNASGDEVLKIQPNVNVAQRGLDLRNLWPPDTNSGTKLWGPHQ